MTTIVRVDTKVSIVFSDGTTIELTEIEAKRLRDQLNNIFPNTFNYSQPITTISYGIEAEK